LLVVLFTGSLNLTAIVEAQRAVYFIFPLFPLFIIFFIGCIAETNRAPFDLAEAESELVSGFMTEHSAVIFVFFFLAEYASIVLICLLTSILFLGGYLSFLPIDTLIYIFEEISSFLFFDSSYYEYQFLFSHYYKFDYNILFSTYLLNGFSSLNLAIKTSVLIFVFI
jgi:NADH-ubiquinone oxidoreductase chain 1